MARDQSTLKRDERLKGKAAARAKESRDGDSFLALPTIVIDSPGFRRASHQARALLIDMASPLRRKGSSGGLPNGGLMANGERLASLGWKSRSTIRNALLDLEECGLLVPTRRGGLHKPTLYAVSWLALETGGNYALDIDPNQWNAVHRGSYMRPTKTAKAAQTARTEAATAARRASKSASRVSSENASPGPSDGRQLTSIGPCDGQKAPRIGPFDGPIEGVRKELCGPCDGHSLERCHLRRPGSAVRLLRDSRHAEATAELHAGAAA